MKALKIQFAVLLAFTCFGLVQTATGTAIGQLNLANCGGGGVQVTATSITWLPVGTAANTGCIITGLGTSVTSSVGTLGSGVTGNINNFPVPGGTGFLTFTSPALTFNLTSFGPVNPTNGLDCITATATVGLSCIATAASPFVLQTTATGTAVILNMSGNILDGTLNTWIGIFSSQFSGVTPKQIADAINLLGPAIGGGPAGSAQNTYSGAILLSPEPSTLSLMLGGGLLCAVGLIRRRRRMAL